MEELVGHGRQVSVLRRALEKGTLSQVLLFSGPASVGKGTLARMVAAALQCEGEGPTACGVCLPCRKVSRGIHPDFRIIAPEETGKRSSPQIKVDAVRENVLHPLALPPHEGKALVFLVDPADALNENAQNALLKSLEEPPAYARFLLVTASPWSLLPTVRSRCQTLTFGTLPRTEMERFLEDHGEIQDDLKPLALARAGGRPGRVFGFQEKAFLKERKTLLDLLMYGLSLEEAPRMVAAAKEFASRNVRDSLEDLSLLLADVRRVEAGLPPRVHSDAAEDLAAVARSRGSDGLDLLSERLSLVHHQLRHNPNPRLLWEWFFLGSD